VLLSDATTGAPIAILDSMVVTSLRTAAVTAVVLRALARPDARTALLVGAGRQGRGQLEALVASGRIERVLVHDLVQESAEQLVRVARDLGVEAEVATDVGAAAAASDVVVTITPARAPVLRAEDVQPGTLVVALGADGPGKQELDPGLVAQSRLVVDLVDQAADSGELQHALAAGLMTRDDVFAELGELLARGGSTAMSADEVLIFDGTGTALQDIAATQLLVDEARRRGIGLDVDLGA
jgi:ornithine cyclodeaminase/alanine dehydrogenase-like protein (mu-crystallin family)